MRIAVVANGDWDKDWGKQELSKYDLIVAADGGANHVFASEHVPHVLVGDLDSILPEYRDSCEARGAKILTYPRDKDETDLELALGYGAQLLQETVVELVKQEIGTQEREGQEVSALDKGPKEIFLLGATGGRLDHFLGNLFLMLKFWEKGLRIRMRDSQQELWLLEGIEKLWGSKGQKLSLLPMTEKAVVRTEGLKYPLQQEILYKTSTRGISNVFLGEAAIVEVSEGIVLVALLSPENKR